MRSLRFRQQTHLVRFRERSWFWFKIYPLFFANFSHVPMAMVHIKMAAALTTLLCWFEWECRSARILFLCLQLFLMVFQIPRYLHFQSTGKWVELFFYWPIDKILFDPDGYRSFFGIAVLLDERNSKGRGKRDGMTYSKGLGSIPGCCKNLIHGAHHRDAPTEQDLSSLW